MLNVYLCSTAQYRRCTGTDGRGQPVYSSPSSVPVRRLTITQSTMNDSSQTVQKRCIYYLSREVHENDMLDGCIVTSVEPLLSIAGKIIGYKAVIRWNQQTG